VSGPWSPMLEGGLTSCWWYHSFSPCLYTVLYGAACQIGQLRAIKRTEFKIYFMGWCKRTISRVCLGISGAITPVSTFVDIRNLPLFGGSKTVWRVCLRISMTILTSLSESLFLWRCLQFIWRHKNCATAFYVKYINVCEFVWRCVRLFHELFWGFTRLSR
jgi:hypothetical protein